MEWNEWLVIWKYGSSSKLHVHHHKEQKYFFLLQLAVLAANNNNNNSKLLILNYMFLKMQNTNY